MTAAGRAAYIDGLRQLADVLERHPGIPLPLAHDRPLTFLFAREDARESLAAAARAMPSPSWEKSSSESEQNSWFDLHGRIAGLRVELTAQRELVCTRVVTGTEDREVEEVVRPAETRKVVKPVEVVEWDCGSLLSAAAAKAVAR